MKQKHFYIYKITLLCGELKSKFYIGKHQYGKINNDYGGSGRIVKAYYNEYGKKLGKTYKKEILLEVDNYWTLLRAEYDYIEKSFNDPNCLNIIYGEYIQTIDEAKEKINNSLSGVKLSWICNIFASSNPEKMSKCIVLSRVSTTDQSLDSQTQAIIKEANKEGFSLNDMILIEDKESAIKLSEEERHGLNSMKDFIEKDKTITHVFIYELSRLSRRQLVLFSIRDYLIERGIQLVCCTPYFRMLEDGKLSQTANLMFSIFASMAESEMQLKQERMMRGKLYNKAHGKNSGHTLLYGYDSKEDHTIYVDEKKARDIVEIFETYAKGCYSLDTLSTELKKKHTIEKHSLYGRARLAFILKSESYCGNSEYPAIVPKELFERCRDIRCKNNTTSKKTKESEALLKRIIYDDRGNHMTFIMFKEERYVSTKTTSPTIKKEAADDHVWMLAKILHKSYIDNREGLRKKLSKELRDLEAERDTAWKNKKRLLLSIDMIEERLVFGKISKGKAEQLEAKVNADIKAIDKQTAGIAKKMSSISSMIEQTYEDAGIDYESLDYEEKVKVIRQVIDKVVVSKPTKRKADLRVIPKVSEIEYVLHVDVYSNECEMETKFLK